MKEIKDLFEVNAYSPIGIACLENGNAGFRIPEYQRTYDWSEENVRRLITDILSGFEGLSKKNNTSAFTFLGTLVLVKDKKRELGFKGSSFSIVDGQQRMTTLTLIACALLEQLRKLWPSVSQPLLEKKTVTWLEDERQSIENSLTDCIYGTQKIGGGKYYPFPRIVRAEDVRSTNSKDESFQSAIAKFLKGFGEFLDTDESEFTMPDIGGSLEADKINDEADKIRKNFRFIKDCCESLNDSVWYDDNNCQFLEVRKFTHGGCRQLWEKTDDFLGNDGSSTIRKIEKVPEVQDFFRTLMLSAYFCKFIAVTTVIIDDENSAFDIFDALNTTGEPLTALETLKPQVIEAEGKRKDRKYDSSPCFTAFHEIDEIMSQNYSETDKKQRETKELVVTFALYLEGRKVSLTGLSAQRRELKQSFDKSLGSDDGSSKFMTSLAHVARYRNEYWNPQNLGQVSTYHPKPEEADQVKLLSAFIHDMKTSLALPILIRYWIQGRENRDMSQYLEALKAVAAFLAIRRAATGGTSGIDTCFRDIMQTGDSDKKYGLCVGAKHENPILSIDKLKEALRKKLSSSKVSFSDREEWLKHVVDIPIYNFSSPLVRFLLLSATHHTAKDGTRGGMRTRKSVSPSDDRNYLSYRNWSSEFYYSTVEHVAPATDKAEEDWDENIYSNLRIRHTIGNLILLPAEENKRIGNTGWSKKKTFYRALTEEKKDERNRLLEKAKDDGIKFSKKTEDIIRGGTRLSLLDGIADVENWDAEFIEKRSRRIGELAWDQLYPWLE